MQKVSSLARVEVTAISVSYRSSSCRHLHPQDLKQMKFLTTSYFIDKNDFRWSYSVSHQDQLFIVSLLVTNWLMFFINFQSDALCQQQAFRTTLSPIFNLIAFLVRIFSWWHNLRPTSVNVDWPRFRERPVKTLQPWNISWGVNVTNSRMSNPGQEAWALPLCYVIPQWSLLLLIWRGVHFY